MRGGTSLSRLLRDESQVESCAVWRADSRAPLGDALVEKIMSFQASTNSPLQVLMTHVNNLKLSRFTHWQKLHRFRQNKTCDVSWGKGQSTLLAFPDQADTSLRARGRSTSCRNLNGESRLKTKFTTCARVH